MPLVAGLVGYFTKLLALEMMFKPLNFVGIKDPWLGWQGIVPRKAAKMAAAATDLLMERIFNLDELMQRLDPDRIIRDMEKPLNEMVDILIREIGEEHVGKAWLNLPGIARRAIISRTQKEMPGVARQIWEEVRLDPGSYIDVKNLLVTNLTKDKALLNDIFKKMGKKEFIFFRNSGFLFGMILGVIQLVCWLIWFNPLLIPLFGAAVGLISDWLALQMLFRPLTPTRFLGFAVQGRFIARQKEVARDYAALVAKELLTPANLIEEILRGPCSAKVIGLIEKHIDKNFNEQLGKAKPLANYFLGEERIDKIKVLALQRAMDAIPSTANQLQTYAADALDIHNTIVSRMDLLTPQEFESLLRPAFKENEIIVILAGAALGFLIGEIQVHLML